MRKITISKSQELFTFLGFNTLPRSERDEETCSICGESSYTNKLDAIYVYIINNLQKANLLPDNYRKMCCYCYLTYRNLGYTSCSYCNSPLRVHTNEIITEFLCPECGKVAKTMKTEDLII